MTPRNATILVVATRNEGKLREIRGLLDGLPISVLSLADVGIAEEVEETGTTFMENAIAKAVVYSRVIEALPSPSDRRASSGPPAAEPSGPASREAADSPSVRGALVLADDSGLEVDALDGAPGVLSARYGGAGLSDEDRCRLVLRNLVRVPHRARTARFICVLALARGGKIVETFEGRVEGLIAEEPRGTGGFGYDPIFYYSLRGRTFGQLSAAEKDAVSHRGNAMRAFRERLRIDSTTLSQ